MFADLSISGITVNQGEVISMDDLFQGYLTVVSLIKTLCMQRLGVIVTQPAHCVKTGYGLPPYSDVGGRVKGVLPLVLALTNFINLKYTTVILILLKTFI